MKKVAIIGTVGYPSRYGGFETLVHHLVEQLNEEVSLTVYCSGKQYPKNERVELTNNVKLVYLPLKANGFQSIPYDIISIIHALFFADTLLILGVSGCMTLPFVRLLTRKKIIVHIDGLEWKRDKWNWIGKRFLKFSERMAIRWSHAHIADNAAIKKYVFTEYNAISELIEYGADHVIGSKPTAADYKQYSFLGKPYAFKVARIEPENNIELILHAFSVLPIECVIVGNWNNSAYGKRLVANYKRFENIHLVDPIYDQHKLDVLRANCWVYVHGHKAGGTNPSLVEAMYLGLPVFAFDVAYNKETTEYKALYFKTVKDLKQQLKEINYQQLTEMGQTMREIAIKRYTWKIVAEKYLNLFQLSKQTINQKKIQHRITPEEQSYLERSHLNHLLHQHHSFEELD